jgi:hypothetical protein
VYTAGRSKDVSVLLYYHTTPVCDGIAKKINPTLTLVLISLKSIPYSSNSQLCCRETMVSRELERGVSGPKRTMRVFYEHAEKLKFKREFSQLLIYCAISYILRKKPFLQKTP